MQNPSLRSKPRFSIQIPVTLVLGSLFITSALVRLAMVWRVPIPVGDGGLFYKMGETLLEHHFVPPASVVYNGEVLPFAYPPLGIGLTALLAWLLRVPLLDVMRFLPAVVSALTVLPVYGLAREILGEERWAWLAAVFFAFYWPGYNWTIMGGGVTRAWGYLWAIAALWAYFRSRYMRRTLWVGITGLFCGLTVLSHPGAAFWCAVTLSAIILCDRHWPWRRRIKALVLVGGIAVAVASPWLVILAERGEVAALLNAARTGHAGWYTTAMLAFPWGLKMVFPFGSELWVDGFSLLGLWNYRYPQRKWLAAAVVLTFVAAPRAPARYATVWVVLLAPIGFAFVAQELWLHRKALRSLLVVMVLFMLLSDEIAALMLTSGSVSKTDLAGMAWLDEHASADSVLVLFPRRWWGNNNDAEWLPALTKVHSACLVQGSEWMGTFVQRVAAANALESAVRMGAPALWRWITQAPCPVGDVLWVPRASEWPLLVASLRADPHFRLLYQDNENFFFRIERSVP